ncbi:MAG: methyltransferase, partial [Streptococcaceae bacterium]|nr:methyltransferase [Streptococcaceae bacterium]
MAKTNMYYEDNQDLKHDIKEIKINLLGMDMTFSTDAGVFSKSAIDYGSRVLLEHFIPAQAKTLLDVGSGYGTLGLTLAKKYGLTPTLIDVNGRALELSVLNAEKNQVKAEIMQSNIYENVYEVYDAIISNPPIRAGKEVVHEILSGAYGHLNRNGHLTIVIQK